MTDSMTTTASADQRPRAKVMIVGQATAIAPWDVLLPTDTRLPLTSEEYPYDLEAQVGRLVKSVDDSVEEDSTELFAALSQLFGAYGSATTMALGDLHSQKKIHGRALSEILRLLGEVDCPGTNSARFWFLVHCLSDDDDWVRSGAALGLARLSDARAIPHIRERLEREPVMLLRERLKRVLAWLSA